MRYNRRRISESRARRSRSSLTEKQVIRKIARIIREAEEDKKLRKRAKSSKNKIVPIGESVEISRSGGSGEFEYSFNLDGGEHYVEIGFSIGKSLAAYQEGEDDASFSIDTYNASMFIEYGDFDDEEFIPFESDIADGIEQSFKQFLSLRNHNDDDVAVIIGDSFGEYEMNIEKAAKTEGYKVVDIDGDIVLLPKGLEAYKSSRR